MMGMVALTHGGSDRRARSTAKGSASDGGPPMETEREREKKETGVCV